MMPCRTVVDTEKLHLRLALANEAYVIELIITEEYISFLP
jgi:hypothetical protein